MIRLTNIKGVQTVTEICGTCKCHIKDLSVNDIIVKPASLNGVTLTGSDGNEITRTAPRPECYCKDCTHD